MAKQKQLGCDYEGNDFGAHYLDSKCINLSMGYGQRLCRKWRALS